MSDLDSMIGLSYGLRILDGALDPRLESQRWLGYGGLP